MKSKWDEIVGEARREFPPVHVPDPNKIRRDVQRRRRREAAEAKQAHYMARLENQRKRRAEFRQDARNEESLRWMTKSTSNQSAPSGLVAGMVLILLAMFGVIALILNSVP